MNKNYKQHLIEIWFIEQFVLENIEISSTFTTDQAKCLVL